MNQSIARAVFVLLLGMFCYKPAVAQMQLRVNPGLAIPVSNMGGINLGGGASFYGHYLIGGKLGLGLGISAFTFGTEIRDNTFSSFPIVASVEYNFLEEGFVPYAGLDLGAGISHSSFNFGGGTVSSSKTDFTLAIRGGFNYFFNDRFGLGLELKPQFIFANNTAIYFCTLAGLSVRFGDR